MPTPLDVATVRERAANFTRDNYVFLGSVIKGFVLAAATLAGLKIFSDPRANWPQAVLLVCSFPAIIVSQVTWARGVLLTNARANIWDTVLPLWMGLMEFTLFGVITPDKEAPPTMWHYWFLILGLHSFGAVGLVVNRIKLTDVEADFEEPLRKLAEKYMGWMKANVIGASIGTVLSFAFWGVCERWAIGNLHDALYCSFAILSASSLCFPIAAAENERSQIAAFAADESID